MTKTTPLKFLIVFLSISPAFGQKVKYKDIFALLSTKQYEQAEPFLKRYLAENDDNPNAFLYRAIIFQEKAGKIDILKQTHAALANMDSAILFYNQAKTTIDEREVKRNKEYYQAYNRRDLRTGEFGVKLSDIQFDIDKKVEALRERIDQVKMTKHFFSLADTLYKKSQSLYTSLQQEFGTERKLYLRFKPETIASLQALAIRFDSCTRAFESYKTTSSSLNNFSYRQTFNPQEIKDFEKDGTSRADLYSDEPKVWNYKAFAEKTKNIIEKEILPMREHLVSYDIEINKLRDRLMTDSVSVRSDLTKLIDRLLYDQLKKYDPEPLPMEVFSLKTADLEYRSVLLEHKSLKDSADLKLQLSMLVAEKKYLDKFDSVATRLAQQNLEEKVQDYIHFVSNTYNNATVLKSYITTLKEYADREKRNNEEATATFATAMNWIVDGTDSIPLAEAHPANRYKLISTVEDKYTVGIHVNDSVSADGYFYTITPSRKPDIKVVFPVDKTAFREKYLPHTGSVSYADATGQLYFVLMYSDRLLKEKYPATVAKIYRTDGLAWSQNIQLPFVPKELLLKPDTGELTIRNETQQVVVDKNGKVVNR